MRRRSFRYQSYTFGIQDTWRVNDMLTVTYGARYDLYGGDSRPALNQTFLSRYGFANNAYISGRGVFQPRIGFDFKPTLDAVDPRRRRHLRGRLAGRLCLEQLLEHRLPDQLDRRPADQQRHLSPARPDRPAQPARRS